MAYRTLELSSISATDLNKVNLLTKMDVYAMAFIDGENRSKKKTPTDKEGGRNPTWNSTFNFNVMEFGSDRATLRVVLRSRRKLGDRSIGEVHVPIKELLDGWNKAAPTLGGDGAQRLPLSVSYQVRKQSGRAKGVLNLSYRFSELVGVPAPLPTSINPTAKCPTCPPPPNPITSYHSHGDTQPPFSSSQPMNMYLAPSSTTLPTVYQLPLCPAYPYPPQHGYAYPPPAFSYHPHATFSPQHVGYVDYLPQQTGYVYPPQRAGYGPAKPQRRSLKVRSQKVKKMKTVEMDVGAGFVGGATAGVVMEDMASDDDVY